MFIEVIYNKETRTSHTFEDNPETLLRIVTDLINRTESSMRIEFPDTAECPLCGREYVIREGCVGMCPSCEKIETETEEVEEWLGIR